MAGTLTSCPRCRGVLFREYDELVCIPCGWRDYPLTGLEVLADELAFRAGKERAREPRSGGMRLG